MIKGIDVSRHQGEIDWKKVKDDDIEFAILRAGYGREASQKDSQFDFLHCMQSGLLIQL